MHVGLTIPTRGPLATPDNIATLVRRAEELGFDHLSVSDHLVVPRNIDSRYPYSESGAWPGAASGECLEQFTLLAWLAAITSRPRLITAVAVIPYRAAMHTAKIAATIDVLSNGRLVLGAGAGWMKEEFEAVGAPPFEERGRVTDEYLQAFKILWTEEDPRFEGRHVRFSEISFPAQTRAEAAPADLDRRREPARAAPHGTLRRRLVSDRQQPAPSARHGGAVQGRRGATTSDGGAERPRSEDHRARVLRGLVRRSEAGRPGSRAASATS